MKRQLKKLTGFVLTLALCAQLLVNGGSAEAAKAAAILVPSGTEGLELQEAGSTAPTGVLSTGFLFDNNYDYYDDDYDYGDSYNYSIDSEGNLTDIEDVPADGKLPEGIKKIDMNRVWDLMYAKTLVFPEGLEELVLKGDSSSVTLPSTLKKLTIQFLSSLEKLELPDGLETLIIDTGSSPWNPPFSLKSLKVPDSVKEFKVLSFSDMDITGNKKYVTVKDKNGEKYIDTMLVFVPEDATSVSIKKGTVSIANGVLSGNSYVTTVDIPDTVTSIGDWAFAGTSSLKSIKLPSKLKELGSSAFCYSGIESIEVPKGVTVINPYTFWNSKSLKSVKLLGKVTEIGSCAFMEDYNLSSINIPDTVKLIDSYAFSGAFGSSYPKASEITIPSSVKTIGYGAFENTYGLKTITIKKGVTTINGSAFRKSGFTSLTLPASVKEIGYNVFAGTNGNVKVAKGSKYVKAYKGGVYIDNYSKLIAYPKDKTSIKFHKKCTEIESDVLCDTKLKKIELPSGLERIGWYAFRGSNDLVKVTIGKGTSDIDYSAFFNCDSLTDISVAKGNKNYSSYEGCLYNKDKTKIIAIPWGRQKVTMNKATTQVQYNILSTRYFSLDGAGLDIELSKNIDTDNISNYECGYYDSFNGRVKLWVNVGSVSATSIATRNAEKKEIAERYNSKFIPIVYRFLEKDSKILDAIKQKSTSAKVKKGKTVAMEYSLPDGLMLVDKLVNDTNTECSITWSSGNSKIATVTKDGTVKGVKAGKTTVKATVEMKSGTKRVLEYSITVQ